MPRYVRTKPITNQRTSRADFARVPGRIPRNVKQTIARMRSLGVPERKVQAHVAGVLEARAPKPERRAVKDSDVLADYPEGFKKQLSPEHRAKLSAAFKGRVCEWRFKISAALKGHQCSEAAKTEISAVKKGRPLSEAHKGGVAVGQDWCSSQRRDQCQALRNSQGQVGRP